MAEWDPADIPPVPPPIPKSVQPPLQIGGVTATPTNILQAAPPAPVVDEGLAATLPALLSGAPAGAYTGPFQSSTTQYTSPFAPTTPTVFPSAPQSAPTAPATPSTPAVSVPTASKAPPGLPATAPPSVRGGEFLPPNYQAKLGQAGFFGGVPGGPGATDPMDWLRHLFGGLAR